MKEKINVGHTNISFHDKENNQFVQTKVRNGLNHLFDYSILKQFDFVPELIYDDSNTSIWKYIDGQMLFKQNNDDLINLARILKELHNSNIKFTKFNIKKRIDAYRKIMNSKNVRIEIIEKLYKKINLILRNMDKKTPVHGDLYLSNIIKDNNNKLFIVDWEYAHMGDKHFELAYFLESCTLNDEQKNIFLTEYKDYDQNILRKHFVLVNYLTILWIHAQDVQPFSDKDCIKRLEELYKEGF